MFFRRRHPRPANEPPVLGRDIPWKDVSEKVCRVLRFTELAKVEDSEVKALDRTTPYGFLTVACEALSGEATIWVTHRTDFLHLWEAFRQRNEAKGEEVIVIPFPEHLRLFFPILRVWLCPNGAFDKILHPELLKSGEAGALEITPIAEWREGLQRAE